MSKNWSTGSHDSEEETPVPPLTKCTAIKSFPGEQSSDLPFEYGEVLTIIEPCNVIYWYLAENRMGRRGIIPITYVKLHTVASDKASPKKCPPPPPPPSSSAGPPPEFPEKAPLPTPQPSSPIPPLPPKPQASPSKPTSAVKTYLTFPRLAQTPSLSSGSKKVTRVHSNEFRGAQTSSRRIPLSHTLAASPGSVRHNKFHRHSQPFTQSPPLSMYTPSHASHSPPHNPLPEVPPPLPSPRNRAKAVLPPVSPKIFPKPAPSSPQTHYPRLPSSISTAIHSRQLPRVPGLASSNSNPDIDRRPPAPLPSDVSRSNHYVKATVKKSTKYKNQKEFSQNSGWFSPNLETVLCKMMYSGQLSALTSVTTGVYIFIHKQQRKKRYVGKSRTAYHDLVQMFHRLFEKKEDKLNTLEKEIKYNSPDAEQWSFRIYSASSSDSIEAEANKNILTNNTLQPSGLNNEVKFSTKESFYRFAEVYARIQRDRANKSVNPIRMSRLSTDEK